MTDEKTGTLDTLVQESISGDTDFQSSLDDMTDDEKSEALSIKTNEVRETEFKKLGDENTKNATNATNQKTRAEKAEGKDPKSTGEGDKSSAPDQTKTVEDKGLSADDVLALVGAGIHKDDVGILRKIAKAFGLSITEALEDATVKIILDAEVAQRKTANATDTGDSPAGSAKRSDSDLLDDLSKGKVPEPGSPEAEQLFWAKRGRTKK